MGADMRGAVLALVVSAGVLVLSLAGQAGAGGRLVRSSCGVRHCATTSVAFVNHANLIAVPIAVPVGMPSYVQYQAPAASYGTAAAVGYGAPAAGAAAPAACAQQQPAEEALGDTVDFVAQACVRCHGPVKPKGGLDLTKPVDERGRLEMLRRLFARDPAQRMPPGRQLAPAELAGIVEQITAEAEAPTPNPAPEDAATPRR